VIDALRRSWEPVAGSRRRVSSLVGRRQTCERCHETKGLTQFRRLSAAEDPARPYGTLCTACRVDVGLISSRRTGRDMPRRRHVFGVFDQTMAELEAILGRPYAQWTTADHARHTEMILAAGGDQLAEIRAKRPPAAQWAPGQIVRLDDLPEDPASPFRPAEPVTRQNTTTPEPRHDHRR
jgi:hypothetical protein